MFGTPEIEALAALLRSDEPLSAGRHRRAFEQRFAGLVGARHALSVTSGTVALELAVGLLGLEPDDEVIATPQTYKATLQPFLRLPVRVRFCDVDPHTLNACPDSIASLVTDRTRAVILVHYGGLPAEMDAIREVTAGRGITLVEDCAHAIGSIYHGRRPGVLGDIGCFSFHSSKIISTLGEGGMITVNSDEWAARVERIRANDADPLSEPSVQVIGGLAAAPEWMLHPGEAFTHTYSGLRHPGTNATMSEAAAAVGSAQLERLDQLVGRRRAIGRRLAGAVADLPHLCPVTEPDGVRSAHHLFTFLVDPHAPVRRDDLVDELRRRGVEIQLRYFPLHLLPEWRARGHHPGECPVAEQLWFDRQVNLPCQPSLSDRDVDHMIEALRAAVTGALARRPARRPPDRRDTARPHSCTGGAP